MGSGRAGTLAHGQARASGRLKGGPVPWRARDSSVSGLTASIKRDTLHNTDTGMTTDADTGTMTDAEMMTGTEKMTNTDDRSAW